MKKKIIVYTSILAVCVAGWMLLRGRPAEVDRTEPQQTTIEHETPTDVVEPVAIQDVQVSAVAESTNKVPEEKLSAGVLTLLDPASNYQECLAALRTFGDEISPTDLAALMGILSKPENESAMRRISYNAVRNDLMEKLLRQKELPEGMGSLLVDVYNSSDHDDMWRNYSIQFMQPYYERAARKHEDSSDSSAADIGNIMPPELEAVQNTLWDALGERENSNAGTALLALDKLSRNHDEFDRDQIGRAMLDLASDESATLANRVTALRLCGEQGRTEAVDLARDLAQSSRQTMLRCVAIATLAEIGTEEDIELLRSYAESENDRIRQTSLVVLEKYDLTGSE